MIDVALLRKVAGLARLRVEPDREAALVADLAGIVGYIDQLSRAELLPGEGRQRLFDAATGASLAATLPPLRPRPDHPELPHGAALIALAADRQGDEVRVPVVVGE